MISANVKQQFADQIDWLDRIDPNSRILRDRSYVTAKRVIDFLFIFLALPLIAPLFCFCAILVKLDSPREGILFTQGRTGRNGCRFKMYKFRSMVPNAEVLKETLADQNELKWPDFSITDDPRVTRVGQFLRRTGLDELPQILNVLKGEMTLVGPRPTSFAAENYALWQTERLDVTPGVTGLWQIVGRGTTEFDERLRLDIAYIECRCLWVDVQIMIRTVKVMFTHISRQNALGHSPGE